MGYVAGSAGTKITTNTGAAVTSGTTAGAGDIILLLVVTRVASATITTANGWQTIATGAMTNGTVWLLGRTAAGAESSWSSPVVSSASQLQTRVFGILTGETLPASFDAAHLTVSSSLTTSPASIPALTGGTSSGTVVAVLGMSRGQTAGSGFTWGSSWSSSKDTDDATGTGTTASAVTAGHLDLASTGNTPTGTITEATAGNGALIVAAFDPAVVATQKSGADTASGSDAATAAAALPGGDTGASVDAGTLAATATAGDTGSSVGAGVLAATLTAGDTASSVDAASVVQIVSVSAGDTAAAADTAGPPSATATAGDTGASSGAAALTAALTAGDTAAGADTAAAAVALTAGDTGTGADNGSASTATTPGYGAGYTGGYTPRSGAITAAGADTAAGTDTATLTANLTVPAYVNGINVSGGEFHMGDVNAAPTNTTFSNATLGVYDSNYHYESQASLNYLAARGIKRVKFPLRWERMQPTLGGALSSTEVTRVTNLLNRAQAAGLTAILDIHNYGVYYEDVAGVGQRREVGVEVSSSTFADLWSRMATAFGGHAALHGFALMNEPQATGNQTAAGWHTASQAAVTAIRAVTSAPYIYVAGFDWQGPGGWITYGNPTPWITDPAGRYYYESHQYFDGGEGGNYGSSYAAYVTQAQGQGWSAGANPDALHTREYANLQVFTGWCATYGVPGFIGELGWPNTGDTTSWNALGQAIYTRCDAAGVPVLYWSTGEFYSNGSDSKSAYEASSNTGAGPLDTPKTQATVIEAHLAGLSGSGAADTATATDAATVTATPTGADTATATDSASVSTPTAKTGTDTASTVDAAALTASFPVGDTAATVDAASVTQGNAVSGSDTATGTDAVSVGATVTASDTSAGTDAATPAVVVVAADTSSGADTASVIQGNAVTGTDTGAASDAATVARAATTGDTATGADTGTQASALTAADAATGTDAASVVTGNNINAGDTASTADTATVTRSSSAGDTVTAADAAGTAAALTASDTATAGNTAATGITVGDTAVTSDAASVVVLVVATDNATAQDLASLAARVAAAELTVALDTATTRAVGIPDNRTYGVAPAPRTAAASAPGRVYQGPVTPSRVVT